MLDISGIFRSNGETGSLAFSPLLSRGTEGSNPAPSSGESHANWTAQDAEAVMWFRRAIEANRNFAFTHLSLAAALACLGNIDEARAAGKAGLALEPSFTIGRFRAGARSDNLVYIGGRERIYEGMRRAGVPE